MRVGKGLGRSAWRKSVRTSAAVLGGVLALVAAWGPRAGAVGWDNDDFIITGAPNFPQYIGVFDHDFTFKGYLDTNFLGVSGMDFDAQGRLVVAGTFNPEIRVYDPSGLKVGGFTQSASPMLLAAGDLKVAPSGNYVIGTDTDGAREFTATGGFVRQYGGGDLRAITFVPGNRLWSAGSGTIASVYDTINGAQVGTFTLDQQTMGYSMQYSRVTNTVLVVDENRDAGGVYERNLNGSLLQQFHIPQPQVNCYSATRGPGGDVFGTAGKFRLGSSYLDTIDWRPDGTVAGTDAVYPVEIGAVRILWAGSVPEPETAVLITLSVCLAVWLRPERRERVSARSL